MDHRVEGSERERIEAAGGDVRCKDVWRVIVGHRGVATSRSFGDLSFKHGSRLPRGEALVLCTPSVACRALRQEHVSAVVASDGLWDVLGDARVAAVVRESLTAAGAGGSSGWSSERAHGCARALVDAALAAEAQDNVSVTVMGFQWAAP